MLAATARMLHLSSDQDPKPASFVSYAVDKGNSTTRAQHSRETYKKKIIRTPNILAISHLFEDALAQYFSNSR